MKKTNRGFTLLETLIVSTFIASTLIYLFIQISNVKTSYDITFRYDTVPGLYGVQDITTYLTDVTYDDLKAALDASSLGYIDITNGTAITNANQDYYNDIVSKINAKMIIFIKENTTDIVSKLDTNTTFSEEMKKFIRRIDTGKIDSLYRVVIEYNDNTFATLKLGTGTTTQYTNYNIGDSVTVGGTSWYVIKNSNTYSATVTLLKESNIDASTYKFDDFTNSYNSSYVKNLVDTYATNLNLGENLISTRLISGIEVADLASLDWTTVKSSGSGTITEPSWLFSSNYWTQTASTSGTNYIWYVNTSQTLTSQVATSTNCGVRPVIVVNKSVIS